MFYLCRRGQENLREMNKSTFAVATETQVVDEMDKHHRENSDDSVTEGRVYDIPGNPNCPVASFESYISKLNPKCEALWQTPRDFLYEGDTIWYNNSPVGKYMLGLMMTNIAKRGQLSRHYIDHSIRATSIVIMDESGFESRHIMKVSGHKSEASLKSYEQNIPNKRKIEISECLSNSLGQNAVGSNTKINIKETDQLDDDLADVFNGPFDLERLSNSQLQNTISDLQSSPALPQQIPLGDVTNRNTAFSKNTVMPFNDQIVYFQPRNLCGEH